MIRRALVVLRYPRGSAPPTEGALQAAIQSDRARLRLPPKRDLSFGLAGPYSVEVDGEPLDEWVAWEA